MDHILNIITYIPLAGALLILFVNKNSSRAIRVVATATAVVDFIVSLYLWINFDPNKLWQFEFKASWIPSLGVDYHFGVDGIAVLLVLLTTFRIIAIVSSYSAIHHRERVHVLLLLPQTA
jgi:NADH-quinone oxidoreductase subunit M